MVLDTWYSLRRSNNLLSPEEFAEQIKAVKKAEIVEIAKMFKLDTVFTLVPEGENDK